MTETLAVVGTVTFGGGVEMPAASTSDRYKLGIEIHSGARAEKGPELPQIEGA